MAATDQHLQLTLERQHRAEKRAADARAYAELARQQAADTVDLHRRQILEAEASAHERAAARHDAAARLQADHAAAHSP